MYLYISLNDSESLSGIFWWLEGKVWGVTGLGDAGKFHLCPYEK
jgi:hypothetical protein